MREKKMGGIKKIIKDKDNLDNSDQSDNVALR